MLQSAPRGVGGALWARQSETLRHVGAASLFLRGSLAAGTGRVIITADLDFPRLLAALGSTSPGLILLRGGNYSESESRDCVRRVLMSIPQTELCRSIVVVDRERIRRRWLPV